MIEAAAPLINNMKVPECIPHGKVIKVATELDCIRSVMGVLDSALNFWFAIGAVGLRIEAKTEVGTIVIIYYAR